MLTRINPEANQFLNQFDHEMCNVSAKFSLLLPGEVITICEECSSFGLFQVTEWFVVITKTAHCLCLLKK